jgi:hypothetical protein
MQWRFTPLRGYDCSRPYVFSQMTTYDDMGYTCFSFFHARYLMLFTKIAELQRSFLQDNHTRLTFGTGCFFDRRFLGGITVLWGPITLLNSWIHLFSLFTSLVVRVFRALTTETSTGRKEFAHAAQSTCLFMQRSRKIPGCSLRVVQLLGGFKRRARRGQSPLTVLFVS